MVTLTFIGTGSASNHDLGQTNAVLEVDGHKLLIDCGTCCWHFARNQGMEPKDFDALYVTHLHADHIGGIEEMAFRTYFDPTASKPTLYCNAHLMTDLWETSLKGGLQCIQGNVVTLTEYFDCVPLSDNQSFNFHGVLLTPVQSVHVMSGYAIKYTYGLMIKHAGRKTFYTGDTQFAPNQIMDFYKQADVIFQDTETTPYKSGVHAHYSDLCTLPDGIRQCMYLMHMQNELDGVEENGFLGCVKPHFSYEL